MVVGVRVLTDSLERHHPPSIEEVPNVEVAFVNHGHPPFDHLLIKESKNSLDKIHHESNHYTMGPSNSSVPKMPPQST